MTPEKEFLPVKPHPDVLLYHDPAGPQLVAPQLLHVGHLGGRRGGSGEEEERENVEKENVEEENVNVENESVDKEKVENKNVEYENSEDENVEDVKKENGSNQISPARL